MSDADREQTEEQQRVHIAAETHADSWGVSILGAFDSSEAAEARAELERDDDKHGQDIAVRSTTIESIVSPHPDCELEWCESTHEEDTHQVIWGSEELTLCDSCLDDYEPELDEVLD